jgi:hypothetical protein
MDHFQEAGTSEQLGSGVGQVGSDSAGQSGDTQGLSQIADAADEASKNSPTLSKHYEAEAVAWRSRMLLTTPRACTHQ